jgi:nicotinate-nucleotide adenylyltransferase
MDHAHLMVAHRPGWEPPQTGIIGEWLAARRVNAPAALREGAGGIYVHPVTALDISSTAIRDLIGRGADPRFLVPESVRRILEQTRCYSSAT